MYFNLECDTVKLNRCGDNKHFISEGIQLPEGKIFKAIHIRQEDLDKLDEVRVVVHEMAWLEIPKSLFQILPNVDGWVDLTSSFIELLPAREWYYSRTNLSFIVNENSSIVTQQSRSEREFRFEHYDENYDMEFGYHPEAFVEHTYEDFYISAPELRVSLDESFPHSNTSLLKIAIKCPFVKDKVSVYWLNKLIENDPSVEDIDDKHGLFLNTVCVKEGFAGLQYSPPDLH